MLIGTGIGSQTAARLESLIEVNVRWLHQALELLERLDPLSYSRSPPGFAPHRAGGHLRHIVEFYQCFLTGIESGAIDYDSRERDIAVETRIEAAGRALRSAIARLKALPRIEIPLQVRMEDAAGLGIAADFMESSLSRELQVLSSHTIHHFALIALTLRLHGIDMDSEFGMAPSTLRYMARGESPETTEALTCAQ